MDGTTPGISTVTITAIGVGKLFQCRQHSAKRSQAIGRINDLAIEQFVTGGMNDCRHVTMHGRGPGHCIRSRSQPRIGRPAT